MKQATEDTQGLCYKLMMMGILCKEPTFGYGDNQLVLANTLAPSSQAMKEKSNNIVYHFFGVTLHQGIDGGDAHEGWHQGQHACLAQE